MTQVIPANDSFEFGDPTWGSRLPGYMGFDLTTGDPSFWPVGQTVLYGAYGGAAAASFGQSPFTGRTFGIQRREEFNADCRIQSGFRLRSLLGAVRQIDQRRWGLATWMRDGSINQDTKIYIRHQDVSGYAFYLYRLVEGGLFCRARLSRFLNGVETVLSESQDIRFLDPDLESTVTLELDVSGIGGGVTRFSGRIKGPRALKYKIGLGPATAQAIVEAADIDSDGPKLFQKSLIIFQFADLIPIVEVDEVSPLASPGGRMGLIMDGEILTHPFTGGGAATTIIDYVEFAEQGSIKRRDEWDRPTETLGTVIADGFFTPGWSLMGDYAGDIHSQFYFLKAAELLDDRNSWARDLAVDGRLVVETPLGSSQEPAEMIGWHRRAADDLRRQHRRVTFRDPRATSGIGVALRGTSVQGLDGQCYLVVLTVGGSLIPDIHLYRRIAGVDTLLAEVLALGAPLSAASNTIELEVLPLSNESPDGTQVLEVKLNGAQVNGWDVSNGIDVFDSAGLVHDFSQERIKQGFLEGMYARSPSTISTASPVRITAWDQLTLSGDPVPGDEALATLTIPTQSSVGGALQTLLVELHWKVDLVVDGRTVSRDMRSGKRGRLAKGDVFGISWRVGSQGATKAEFDAFQQFWEDHAGAERPFAWTPPGEFEMIGVFKFIPGTLDAVRLFEEIGPGTRGFFIQAELVRIEE